MVRRGKAVQQEEGAPLARTYEGQAVFGKLLTAAGSAVSVEEVVEILKQAQAAQMGADEAFLDLFDEEPRFSSPTEARRLYSNLFGLWDRLEAGGPLEPKGKPGPVSRAAAPAPPPHEGPLTPEFVEAAWRHLVDLPPREAERWLHRWENTQPELTEALRVEAGEDEAVLETADTLAFELWGMLDLAQPGKRIRPVLMAEFRRALDAKALPEPALDHYVDEAVEEALLDDEAPVTQAQAESIARIARGVLRALAKAR